MNDELPVSKLKRGSLDERFGLHPRSYDQLQAIADMMEASTSRPCSRPSRAAAAAWACAAVVAARSARTRACSASARAASAPPFRAQPLGFWTGVCALG